MQAAEPKHFFKKIIQNSGNRRIDTSDRARRNLASQRRLPTSTHAQRKGKREALKLIYLTKLFDRRPMKKYLKNISNLARCSLRDACENKNGSDISPPFYIFCHRWLSIASTLGAKIQQFHPLGAYFKSAVQCASAVLCVCALRGLFMLMR